MKHSFITIILLSISLMFVCCHNDDTEFTSEEYTVINLGITTNYTASKADTYSSAVLGDAEYAIKTFRIYAFGKNPDYENDKSQPERILDVMEYVEASSSAIYNVQYEIKVPLGIDKSLYIIVNEPSSISDELASIDTEEDLKDIDFKIADAMTKAFLVDAKFEASDFVIPMTVSKSEIDATVNQEMSLSLTRAVARVDLMLDKSSTYQYRDVKVTENTTFTVNGITYGSKLLEPETLSAPETNSIEPETSSQSSLTTLLTKTSDYSSAARVLSFYISERAYDKDNIDNRITIGVDKINVDGDDIAITSGDIILGDVSDEVLTEINRNYVYRIYATYNAIETIDPDLFTIVDWDDVEIDASMGGVILGVDNEIAMDWLRNGNSYTSPEVAFGSNREIEIYLPVVNGIDEEGIATYEFIKADNIVAVAGATYELLNLDIANSYIAETKWLESVKLTFVSQYAGYVQYVYKPLAINYKLQQYPIRFKSENVVKQLSAVYDNGYIPYEFLPDVWKERAPNGVLLAKRGYAKDPSTTEDIFYRDDDGFYRGEHTLTAEETYDYCINNFSQLWYNPSNEDMLAALMGVTELGMSYRFQTTGSEYGEDASDAFYWSSTEYDDDNYWVANFIKKSETVTEDNVTNWVTYKQKNEKHFVRCIKDM